MTRSQAEEIYGVHRWGAGYLQVGEGGNLRVHPTREPEVWVDLPDVIAQLKRRKSGPPVLLRFPQIIESQVRLLHQAFHNAIREYAYAGKYRGVFPIKVNQMQAFLEDLVTCGEPWRYGLEAGTKPELAVALTAGLPPGSLVICNGYKDRAYVELAAVGVSLGHELVIVVEKLHELDLILKVSERMGVRPALGFRIKVHARGTGKWEKSGGEASKFGLSTGELLHAVEICRQRGWLDRIELLHFHIGSQITDVRRIKQGVQEAARYYARLRTDGVNVRYIDVGGGLGVDYDGSRTSADSSVNYTLQEYANDVVYSVAEICDEAGVPVPDLVSESGRAISAYHAMAIFAVEQQQTLPRTVPLPELPPDAERCVLELLDTSKEIGPKNFMESYHDTLELVNQVNALFHLGKLSLEERAVAEAKSAEILRDVVYFAKTSGRRVPEEIEELEKEIAARYVVNMSVFQCMPDMWALGQLFPIAPIHRLDEHPSVWATLVDITCDSDGKVDCFVDVREDQDAIRLHELRGEAYHLGAFLLGAYQDAMGDFHNMLGETKEARVVVTGPGESHVTLIDVAPQTSGEVMELFGHRRQKVRRRLRAGLEAALGQGEESEARRALMLKAFDRVLNSTPYLT